MPLTHSGSYKDTLVYLTYGSVKLSPCGQLLCVRIPRQVVVPAFQFKQPMIWNSGTTKYPSTEIIQHMIMTTTPVIQMITVKGIPIISLFYIVRVLVLLLRYTIILKPKMFKEQVHS